MAKLIADVGPAAGKTLVSTHIDSWEVGFQNWTPQMPAEFRQLARLRPEAIPAGDHRPGGRFAGSLGAVPLGPAADDCRPDRGELRRPDAGTGPPAPPATVDRALRRRADGQFLLCPHGRRADVRVLDRRRRDGRPGQQDDVRRPPTFTASRSAAPNRSLPSPQYCPLDRSSLRDEGAGRRGVLRRREPFRVPPLCPPAVARPPARHDVRPLGRPLRSDGDLVALRAAVARVPEPLQSPAAAGAFRGRRVLPANRGRAELRRLPSRTSPGCPATTSGGPPGVARPKYDYDGCSPEAVLDRHARRGRPDRAAQRHELPAPGPAAGPRR